jgi:hypothetical protein
MHLLNLPLAPENLPEALRNALDYPDDSVEVAYIRRDRVAYAELNPEEVPDLRDRVSFILVAGESKNEAHTLDLWQKDTASGLLRLMTGLKHQEAVAERNRLAGEWPERTDIMDANQLKAYIVDNECAGHNSYDSLESLIAALRSQDGEGSMWMSTHLWATTPTESGWAVWSLDGFDSGLHLEGVFSAEAEARQAAKDASDRASREWDRWLLELAQAEQSRALAAGDAHLADDLHLAITHLRSWLRSPKMQQ